jgi:cytochrome b561
MLKNTFNAYGVVSKLFHWLVAIVIISMLVFGFLMDDIGGIENKYVMRDLHKASGVVALCLILMRVFWRLVNQAVQPDSSMPHILQIAAKMGHFLLYVFMLLMPISGILMVTLKGREINMYGLFSIPSVVEQPAIGHFFKIVHETTAVALATLLTLHIIVAFYHHFIRKDDTLKRML